MKKITINVKEKSVNEFFNKNVVINAENGTAGVYTNNLSPSSPYHWMRDEIFFKKESGVMTGEKIQIELSDRSVYSGKELVNTYLYEVKEYDDVAYKLVLIDFKITIKK